jgi:hypothetical protein
MSRRLQLLKLVASFQISNQFFFQCQFLTSLAEFQLMDLHDIAMINLTFCTALKDSGKGKRREKEMRKIFGIVNRGQAMKYKQNHRKTKKNPNQSSPSNY